MKELTKFIDDLSKDVKKFQKKINDDKHDFNELFNLNFMLTNTKFSSFNEFLTAGGWIINSNKEFESILGANFDEHVRKNTKFSNWNDMFEQAQEQFITKEFNKTF